MAYCPPYETSNGTLVACGPVHACPGDTINANGCDTCTGDQVLYLYDGNNDNVDYGDDGCPGTSCSALLYHVPDTFSCQDFTIQQSCVGGSCGGTVSYEVTSPPLICPDYSQDYPASTNCGPVEACSGASIYINNCGRCQGNTTLSFVNSEGTQIAFDDDGCWTGSACSAIHYQVPMNTPCQNYTIEESCATGSCGGTVTYEVNGGLPNGQCAPYDLSNTYSAQCGPIYACPGAVLEFSTCDTCTGDEIMMLMFEIGNLASYNDNGCGPDSLCSAISYTVPLQEGCQYFLLEQKCQSDSCTGTTVYEVTGVSAQPTLVPSLAPTKVPTVAPSAKPTCAPSETPTCAPSKTPTCEPSVAPSIAASLNPTGATVSYVEFFSSTTCSGAADEQGAVNYGECMRTDSGYLMITCDHGASSYDWTASYYASDTCTGVPLSTAVGSDPCACTTLSGMNMYVNCAGVPSDCTGGGGSSSTLSAGALAGIAVGSVGGVAVIALAAAYFMGVFKASTPLARAVADEKGIEL